MTEAHRAHGGPAAAAAAAAPGAQPAFGDFNEWHHYFMRMFGVAQVTQPVTSPAQTEILIMQQAVAGHQPHFRINRFRIACAGKQKRVGEAHAACSKITYRFEATPGFSALIVCVFDDKSEARSCLRVDAQKSGVVVSPSCGSPYWIEVRCLNEFLVFPMLYVESKGAGLTEAGVPFAQMTLAEISGLCMQQWPTATFAPDGGACIRCTTVLRQDRPAAAAAAARRRRRTSSWRISEPAGVEASRAGARAHKRQRRGGDDDDMPAYEDMDMYVPGSDVGCALLAQVAESCMTDTGVPTFEQFGVMAEINRTHNIRNAFFVELLQYVRAKKRRLAQREAAEMSDVLRVAAESEAAEAAAAAAAAAEVLHVEATALTDSLVVPSDPSQPTKATDAMCAVCLAATVTHVLVPCGHACFCTECVEQLPNQCPICRANIALKVRLYY